jgi:hypothetical protein
MARVKKVRKHRHIPKLLLIGTAVTLTAVAGANGLSDIWHMNQVEGISSTSTPASHDFALTSVVPQTLQPTDTNATISSTTKVNKPVKPVVKPRVHTKVTAKTKLPGNIKVHYPKPSLPGGSTVPPISTDPTQPDCFVAATEGIYVPRGGNIGPITITADKPLYWRSLSTAITTSDAGTDVPAEFPAYIVLESGFDPNTPSTKFSFHIHSRSTAPLGEYCPTSPAGQIGIEAYLGSPDNSDNKLFDIPMNINIVEKLGKN